MMKMGQGKRFLSLLPALCIAFMLVLMMVAPAQAAMPTGALGDAWDGVDFDALMDSGNGIYYGTYDHATSLQNTNYGAVTNTEGAATPILWNVMGEESGEGAITLLSKYVLDSQWFRSSWPFAGNFYNNSYIRTWLNDDFMESFTNAEDTGMKTTDVITGMYYLGNASMEVIGDHTAESDRHDYEGEEALPWVARGDKVYLPWGKYADSTVYWTAGNDASEGLLAASATDISATLKNGSTEAYWWLRSPFSLHSSMALHIYSSGDVKYEDVDSFLGVRPAFKLSPESILFASEILGDITGRPDATLADGINYVEGESGAKNLKLTILNDSLASPAFAGKVNGDTMVVSSGGMLNLVNTASVTGRLAYKIVEESGGIVGYGAAVGDTDIIVDTSALPDGNYALYVWAQKDNAANSHEGSRPIYFTLKVGPDTTPPTVLSVIPTGTDMAVSGNIVIIFSERIGATGTVSLNSDTLTGSDSWSSTNYMNDTYTIPYSGLTYSTDYTVNISGFKDEAGNEMLLNMDYMFSTIAPDITTPTVLSITPAGTGAAVNGDVVITFSETMGTIGTVSINDAILTGSWSTTNYTDDTYIIPYSGLTNSTIYTMNISGFKDEAGNDMPPVTGYTFITSAQGGGYNGVDLSALSASGNGIYYGMYKHYDESTVTPILWNVMGEESGEGAITLLSKYVLTNRRFHATWDAGDNYYNDSDIRAWLNGEFMESFTNAEDNGIKITDIITGMYLMDDSDIEKIGNFTTEGHRYEYKGNEAFPWVARGDKVYLPWGKYDGSAVYWTAGNDASEGLLASITATYKTWTESTSWWLRSPSSDVSHSSLTVSVPPFFDTVFTAEVDGPLGVRPVFKINPEFIIFASEILSDVTGRPEATLANGTNYVEGEPGAKNLKLTVLNDSLTPPVFEGKVNGDILTVDSGGRLDLVNTASITGKLVYKIVDRSSDGIVGYGTADSATDITVDASGLPEGDYTLYVWAQEDNAINSHEGSRPIYFTLAVGADATSPTVLNVTPAGTDVAVSGNIVITFSETIGATGMVSLNEAILTGADSWSTTNHTNDTYTIPYSALANSTTYTVDISGFKDGAGNEMAPSTGHTFTTIASGPTPPAAIPIITTTPGALAEGTVGTAYSVTLAATNIPTNWAISSGALPAGLTLSNSGTISGTPSATGAFTFSVTATNSLGASAPVAFSITVGSGGGGSVGGGGGGSAPASRVTYKAGPGGRITAGSVGSGGRQTFTITPNEGYEIDDVLVDGRSVGAVDTYAFTDATSNAHTLEAVFKETVIAEEPVPTAPWQENPFEDVKEGDWFYEHVLFVHSRGLVNGTGASSFSPNMPLTRAMLVTILYRLDGSPDTSGLENPFSDVAADKWYADAVKWAAKNSIVIGYSGKFNPEDNIIREQLMTILYRYMEYAGTEYSVTEEYVLFTDEESISGYAKAAVQVLYKLGIVSGVDEGTISPQGTATRAQLAAILQRFLEM